jgi:glycerophosphoryl diester phosphodiesterase
MSFLKIILYVFLFTFLYLFGLVFTLLGGFFTYTMKNTKGSCSALPKNETISFLHRSDVSSYQENSLEAILSAVQKGMNPEMDIYQLKSGEFIVFHDQNASDLTGVNILVNEATYEEISKLKYLKTVRNTTYSTSPSIPLFSEVLKQVCTQNSTQSMNFDIKFIPNSDNSEQFFNLLESSPCSCNEYQKFLISTPYFYATSYIRDKMANSRCKAKLSIYLYPNIYPGGEYFWLKTRAIFFIGNPDIIEFYNKILDKNPTILNELKDEGFCTSIYGSYQNVLNNYNYTFSSTYDIANASVSDVEYENKVGIFYMMIALFVLGSLSLLVGLILSFYLCCRHQKAVDVEPVPVITTDQITSK